MRIDIRINDETIRKNIREAVENAEQEEEIYFEFESERTEFMDDCMNEITDKLELYDDFSPDYDMIVRDFYNLYFE